MNNQGSLGLSVNGSLPSGSSSNIRWEVTNVDSGSGLFSLIVRRGDDYENNKTILETWNNISLDPNQNNFITYVIGDTKETVVQEDGNYYLQLSGSYANKSKYIRVKSVNYPTPGYFNQLGQPYPQYTASLPLVGSGSSQGSFSSAQGAIWGCFNKAPLNMFENIKSTVSTAVTPTTNVQGISQTDYNIALSLLANQDAYDFNVIYAPGINAQNAPSAITSMLTLAQNRGDAIAVIDATTYGQTIAEAVTTPKSASEEVVA